MSESTRSNQSLSNWLDWLLTLHPRAIDLGLHRVAAVAQSLGLDTEQSAKVITVAGTNGKGSTVAAVRALLSQLDAGARVGVYTSPHLLRFNERIVIDGQERTDAEIVAAFEKVEAARQVTPCPDSGQVVTLSYFEFTTLAALYLFAEAGLDYWLLEVGLGGRLDAVNIIDPDIAVITQLGLDHQDYLGDTLTEIEAEKAGILRAGIPVVIASRPAPQTVLRIAQSLGCDIHTVNYAETVSTAIDSNPAPLHPAAWAAAGKVAELLGFSPAQEQFAALQRSTTLAGRQSIYYWQQREWLLDVAHNVDSVAWLAGQLARTDKAMVAVCAMMADKAIEEMLESVADCVAGWHFCELDNLPRAATARAMAGHWASVSAEKTRWQQIPVTLSGNMNSALDSAVQCTAAGDRILVFGSFHTVAEALAIIEPAIA